MTPNAAVTSGTIEPNTRRTQPHHLSPVGPPAPAQYEVSERRDSRSCAANKRDKDRIKRAHTESRHGKSEAKTEHAKSREEPALPFRRSVSAPYRVRPSNRQCFHPNNVQQKLKPEQIQFMKKSTRTVCASSPQVP